MVSALSLRASAMLFTFSLDRNALPVASAVVSDGILMPKPPCCDVCSGASFAPLQTSQQGGFGMSIPSLTTAEATGSAFLSKLNVKSIAEARKLSADTIQAATGGGLTFRPVADGYVISNDLFTLFEQGKFNDTPVLLGHTSDETSAFGGAGSVTPAAFEKQITEQFGAQADAILKAYPHTTDAEAVKAARHVRNDTSFGWNMWTWA